jgi:hypothetical protein
MIYQADIRDVRELKQGKAALVFSEPMWEEEFSFGWGEIVRFADDVLQSPGWLAVLSAVEYLPYHLHEMMEAAKGTSVRYRWTMVRLMLGSDIWCHWNPIYMFSKGDPLWPDGGVTDIATIARGETRLPVYTELIEAFTKPGDLVSDPYMGPGTIRLAADAAGRRFEGSDIDPQWI